LFVGVDQALELVCGGAPVAILGGFAYQPRRFGLRFGLGTLDGSAEVLVVIAPVPKRPRRNSRGSGGVGQGRPVAERLENGAALNVIPRLARLAGVAGLAALARDGSNASPPSACRQGSEATAWLCGCQNRPAPGV
jgi:hypothetical protein